MRIIRIKDQQLKFMIIPYDFSSEEKEISKQMFQFVTTQDELKKIKMS